MHYDWKTTTQVFAYVIRKHNMIFTWTYQSVYACHWQPTIQNNRM